VRRICVWPPPRCQVTVVLGLLAAGSYGVADLFSLRLVRRAHLLTALVWILLVGLAISLPLGLATGGLPSTPAAWAAVGRAGLGGALYVAAFACLLMGLRRGSLSVVSPITALEGAFAAVVAVVLGEKIGVIVSAALAMAVLGGLLAALESGAHTASGAAWAMSAAFFSGLSLVVYGSVGTTISPFMTVAASRLAGLLIAVPLFALSRPPWFVPDLRRDAWLSATLETCGFLAAATALMRGPTAVAAVMITQFPIFGVGLGLVVMHERPARHQLIGVFLTVVGVTLLAVGQGHARL
jgi:drug/metabolite transporter (DMT)-like permease